MQGDGVYTDATWRDGVAGIGIVLVENGKVTKKDCAVAQTRSNTEAEGAAVVWAKFLYPEQPVFCDCTTAAAQHAANWIPREQNREAHKTAKLALTPTPQPNAPRDPTTTFLRKKRKRGAGRGVIPAAVMLDRLRE